MTPEMQKLLDQMEPEIRRAFLEAIDRITSAAQLVMLEDAIKAGDIERAIAVLQLDRTIFAPLDQAIQRSQLEGGALMLTMLLGLKDPFLAGAWFSVLTAGIHAPKPGHAITRPN